jgi:hypothetical protein
MELYFILIIVIRHESIIAQIILIRVLIFNYLIIFDIYLFFGDIQYEY